MLKVWDRVMSAYIQCKSVFYFSLTPFVLLAENSWKIHECQGDITTTVYEFPTSSRLNSHRETKQRRREYKVELFYTLSI